MPSYRYSAYDKSGKLRKGIIDAPSSTRAGELLAEQNLVAVEIIEGAAESVKKGKVFGLAYHSLFCKGLSSYLNRGVPLAEALRFLSRHSNDRRVSAACLHLHESVQGGKRLSAALEETGLFRDDLVRIVDSGERTSALSGVLDQVARQYAMEDKQRRKIRQALTYPVAMSIIGIGVVVFLLTYVVPKLTELFSEMGQQLPLPTRILLAITAFLRSWGLPLLLVLLLVILYIRRRKKKFTLPFFRRVRESITLSLVMSHLSTLLSAGIPLVQALNMASAMDSNAQRWLEAARLVKEGFRFDRALEKQGAFSEEVIYILRIGEMGGDLPGAIKQVSDMKWEEALESMERLSTLAEPVLVLFLGFSVGFVVLAILLPIFELSSLAG
ncbi:MAG: type II secretion system F family protein [Gammaproteobacteria bacterium]|nr:type II secretion system F family protein [Gammaproteobacteria bacterium]NLD95807.1 type II secretion system F family protein [Synergistaceae bacterium]